MFAVLAGTFFQALAVTLLALGVLNLAILFLVSGLTGYRSYAVFWFAISAGFTLALAAIPISVSQFFSPPVIARKSTQRRHVDYCPSFIFYFSSCGIHLILAIRTPMEGMDQYETSSYS